MLTIEALRQANNIRLATSAFCSVFYRSPDRKETNEWAGRLRAGIPLSQLIQEMRAKTKADPVPIDDSNASSVPEVDDCVIEDLLSLPDEEFIQAIYQRFLGRRADADGKKFFGDQLAGGGERLQAAMDVFNSTEGLRYRLITTNRIIPQGYEGEDNLSPVAKVFLRRLQACSEVT
jgi:hypothetical protein